MLSCKEVSTILATDALEQSSRFQRISVRLHLLMCRHCRRYKTQLVKIGETARSLWGMLQSDPGVEERIERAALARAEEILGQPPSGHSL